MRLHGTGRRGCMIMIRARLLPRLPKRTIRIGGPFARFPFVVPFLVDGRGPCPRLESWNSPQSIHDFERFFEPYVRMARVVSLSFTLLLRSGGESFPRWNGDTLEIAGIPKVWKDFEWFLDFLRSIVSSYGIIFLDSFAPIVQRCKHCSRFVFARGWTRNFIFFVDGTITILSRMKIHFWLVYD